MRLCSHEAQQSTGQACGIRIPQPCAADRSGFLATPAVASRYPRFAARLEIRVFLERFQNRLKPIPCIEQT
jgi:hypothetical protein